MNNRTKQTILWAVGIVIVGAVVRAALRGDSFVGIVGGVVVGLLALGLIYAVVRALRS